jgi:hypothetical protein
MNNMMKANNNNRSSQQQQQMSFSSNDNIAQKPTFEKETLEALHRMFGLLVTVEKKMIALELNNSILTSEVKELKSSNTQMKELLQNVSNKLLSSSSSSSEFIADDGKNIRSANRTLEEFKLAILNENKLSSYILSELFKEILDLFK